MPTRPALKAIHIEPTNGGVVAAAICESAILVAFMRGAYASRRFLLDVDLANYRSSKLKIGGRDRLVLKVENYFGTVMRLPKLVHGQDLFDVDVEGVEYAQLKGRVVMNADTPFLNWRSPFKAASESDRTDTGFLQGHFLAMFAAALKTMAAYHDVEQPSLRVSSAGIGMPTLIRYSNDLPLLGVCMPIVTEQDAQDPRSMPSWVIPETDI